MNAWGEDYHELDVDSYGRSGTLADYVDGLGPFRKPWDDPYEITRNVNPDRHARIRAKHFHLAFLFNAYAEEMTLTAWQRRFSYLDACDACDWGTR